MASASGVDLRSDTVTRPTAAMRRVMAAADVGDDLYREDPTVAALEEATALILGKEAALFVPSGTMGNQLALLGSSAPGDEIWLHPGSHIMAFEQGAASRLLGLQTRPFPVVDGRPALAEMEAALDVSEYSDSARPAVLCLENTEAYAGGRVLDRSVETELVTLARRHEMWVHVDGARLWNASVASGSSPATLAKDADSVMVCYSKSLGAPIGSALAGPAGFIERARRGRALLGGAMRQVGIVAAGALHALENHLDRLTEDHRRARLLCELLRPLLGPGMRIAQPETNFVIVETPRGQAIELAEATTGAGVGCLALDSASIRLVTHLDVDDEDIARAVAAIAGAVELLGLGIRGRDDERGRLRNVGGTDDDRPEHQMTPVNRSRA